MRLGKAIKRLDYLKPKSTQGYIPDGMVIPGQEDRILDRGSTISWSGAMRFDREFVEFMMDSVDCLKRAPEIRGGYLYGFNKFSSELTAFKNGTLKTIESPITATIVSLFPVVMFLYGLVAGVVTWVAFFAAYAAVRCWGINKSDYLKARTNDYRDRLEDLEETVGKLIHGRYNVVDVPNGRSRISIERRFTRGRLNNRPRFNSRQIKVIGVYDEEVEV